MSIRVGIESDADAVIAHRRHMVQTSPHAVTAADEVEADPRRVREWIQDHAGNPGWLLLVATESPTSGAQTGGRILGALSFRCGNRRRVRHHGDFGVSVVEDFRGKGIGRALLETLIDWATHHEFIEKIYLGVFESNSGARRLYERLGFEIEAIRGGYFKLENGTYCNDILMSRWVKPRPR
ncbi:MAG: N-acetyltransferase family protein [Phycisphaerales bacterium]